MLATDASAAKPIATRAFGRFELRELLGKSELTMSWIGYDPRAKQEVMLTMPRVQPAGPAALAHWMADAKQAARLNHPHLAHVVEIGVEENWPFITVDRALGLTLSERLAAQPQPSPEEAVDWLIQLAEGLAFAHQSRIAHGDIQLHQVLISEQGTVRLMALAAAGTGAAPVQAGAADDTSSIDSLRLHDSREAAARDLLTIGLLLHRLLAGAPAFGEGDISRIVMRLAPHGRDLLRLPRSTPLPVAEGLRAIVDRATASQPRQRYHNTRTLLTALMGWRDAARREDAGMLDKLLDRLRAVGHLPAGQGVGTRVARLAVFSEGKRTDEMAEIILQDMALSLELLRHVNSAQVQGTQAAGNGPVLTVRRAISLVGLKGLRHAAASLRPWPGNLKAAHATALQELLDQVRLAGHVAQVLRPAGYDPEVIYLVAAMQNMGRLMVRCHFPDEAAEIAELMTTVLPTDPEDSEQAGMDEELATHAVLGVGMEAIGAAVARHWGFSEEVLLMLRRLPLDRPVRHGDGDADMLRLAASAANEVVDVVTHSPPSRLGAGLAVVVQRYARSLGISTRDISEALHGAKVALDGGGSVASAHAPAGDAPASSQSTGVTGFAALLAARKR
jgi:non-specific serine/threonine protein kinase